MCHAIAGLGYVNVVDPSTYDNLPNKLNDYEDDEYVATTAVTHQLHCLVSIFTQLLSPYPRPSRIKEPHR